MYAYAHITILTTCKLSQQVLCYTASAGVSHVASFETFQQQAQQDENVECGVSRNNDAVVERGRQRYGMRISS